MQYFQELVERERICVRTGIRIAGMRDIGELVERLRLHSSPVGGLPAFPVSGRSEDTLYFPANSKASFTLHIIRHYLPFPLPNTIINENGQKAVNETLEVIWIWI